MRRTALDANGNTLCDARDRSYSWDFENRLTQAVNPGVGTTNFRYDPFGWRIQKSGPNGTTNYLYDGTDLLEEVDQAGNVLARYMQDNEIDEPLAQLRSSTASYYQGDGLESITSLTNASGAVASTYSYDGFGNLTILTGAVANSFHYTGREFDTDVGLNYNRMRYYDPFIGRFTSSDPAGFRGGLNLYDYVGNRPTMYVDPLGLSGANPGGPYHPPDGIHTKCREGDNCQQISAKLWLLSRMIVSHTGWDYAMAPPRGGGRHAPEISALWAQLAECIDMYQKTCKGPHCRQPKSERNWWDVFSETFWEGVRDDQWYIEYILTHPNPNQGGAPGLPPPPGPVPVFP